MTTILAAAGLDSTYPPRSLTGRVALVTASISGIGLVIATELAAHGACVVLNGVAPRHEAEHLCRTISATHDVPVSFDDTDLSDPKAIRDMIERTCRSTGMLDILVNNPAAPHIAPIESVAAHHWDSALTRNLSAVFHGSKAILPEMRRRGFGRILNILPTCGLIASPFASADVATAFGLVGLTKVIALEAAGSGITCNAICRDGSRPSATRSISRPANDIAAPAAFLCSEQAASITGAVISLRTSAA